MAGRGKTNTFFAMMATMERVCVAQDWTGCVRDQVRGAAFDRVVITAPDRLARNSVHQMFLIEELERGG